MPFRKAPSGGHLLCSFEGVRPIRVRRRSFVPFFYGFGAVGLAACSSTPEARQDADTLSTTSSLAARLPRERPSRSASTSAFPKFKPIALEPAAAPADRSAESSGIGLSALVGALILLLLAGLLIGRVFRRLRKKKIEIDPRAEVVLLGGRFIEGTDERKREKVLLGLGARGITDLASVATVLREPNGNLVILERR